MGQPRVDAGRGGATPAPVASVIVVATDELRHLRDCLPSLAALDGPATEVIVVDNASGDGTGAWVAASYPAMRVVRSDERLGYAPANNLGFRHARGAYLIVLNPDTRVDRRFVHALVATSRERHDRALVTSRICLYDEPALLNTCGNVVHVALLAACRGLGEPVGRYPTSDEVASISGCAFLIPRPVLAAIGPFATAIYPYLEDTELSLRAWLAGYACVTAPGSLVYHKYAIRLTPRKFYFIERNRWLVMLRCYRLGTLALLAPVLAAVELLAWGWAARQGRAYLAAKARAAAALVRHVPGIRRGRRELAALRRRDDRELLVRLQGSLPVGQLAATEGAAAGGLVRVVDAVLGAYLRVVRPLVRW